MFSRGLAGERLVNHPDPAVARLYSLMSPTQLEWAENGYDPDFVSDPKSWRGESPEVYKNPGPCESCNDMFSILISETRLRDRCG
jgi:hypothetical protein